MSIAPTAPPKSPKGIAQEDGVTHKNALGDGKVYVGQRLLPGPWARLVLHGNEPRNEARLEFATDEVTPVNLALFFDGSDGAEDVLYIPNNPVGLNVSLRLRDARVSGKAFLLKGEDSDAWQTLVFSARTTRDKLDWGSAPNPKSLSRSGTEE